MLFILKLRLCLEVLLEALDMLQYSLCWTSKVPVLATNATGLSTGSTLASYAATDTDSYAGGLTGLVTGAGYATTVTSVYGGCAPALNAFASADGTGALAGGLKSLFGKAQASVPTSLSRKLF